jgi:hypothetical protein
MARKGARGLLRCALRLEEVMVLFRLATGVYTPSAQIVLSLRFPLPKRPATCPWPRFNAEAFACAVILSQRFLPHWIPDTVADIVLSEPIAYVVTPGDGR